ncbi:MAG: hypothetical protein LBD01_03840 [Puniceicoccales bacterium]|jgi:hypothetical protein|nr:hypothetical protein [Puniceicoccales bacterium]
MTLLSAYVILGVVLGTTGLSLASGLSPVCRAFRAFPRSFPAALLFWGSGVAWFVFRVTQLSEVDLSGFPRGFLVGGFVSVGLLALFCLRDLLAVRGLAALLLLSARALLDAGYMQQPRNLVLSVIAYILVVLGIWWGVTPYVFRNWLFWVLKKPLHYRVVGAFIATSGGLCLVTAFLCRS